MKTVAESLELCSSKFGGWSVYPVSRETMILKAKPQSIGRGNLIIQQISKHTPRTHSGNLSCLRGYISVCFGLHMHDWFFLGVWERQHGWKGWICAAEIQVCMKDGGRRLLMRSSLEVTAIPDIPVSLCLLLAGRSVGMC